MVKRKTKTYWQISVGGILWLSIFCFFCAPRASAALNSGTFVSAVKDMFFPVNFDTISWTETLPANTAVAMELRAGNVPVPDGTWTGWTTFNKNDSIGAPLDGKRYVQYRLTLNSDDINVVPSVQDVTLTAYVGTFTSSPYSTKNYGNILQSISWSQTNPSGAAVFFQVRTSPDNVTWSPWCGPDNGASGCNSTTYFADRSGGETIDADLRDGNSDMWIQYKATLIGDVNTAETPILSDVNMRYDLQPYSGVRLSPVKDTGQKSQFGNLSWTDNTATLNVANPTAQTSVTLRIRAGNTSTPDGTWTAWTSVAQGGSLSAFSGNQYIQYEATLSTYDSSIVPNFQDVSLPYIYYPSGTFQILSSPYNTGDGANLLAKIQWNQNIPTLTKVKFQMRSAPDTSGAPDWANGSKWCGPTTCAATTGDADFAADYYETTPAGETANAINQTGHNDQWVQYVAFLVSNDSAYTPTLSEVTLTYVVNAAPEAELGSQPSQGVDGKIVVDYKVRDIDTSTATAGNQKKVEVGLQYWNGSAWQDAAALSGNYGIVAVADSASPLTDTPWTNYQLVWSPKTDYPNIFSSSDFKIRIKVNDREAASNVGYSNDSGIFTLDTKNPTLPTPFFTIDHSVASNQLAIQTPSDDSPYRMKVSSDSNFTGASFESFSNAYTASLTDDPARMYVRIQDQYGNYSDASAITPDKPRNISYYDVSRSLEGVYQEFIVWDAVSPAKSGSGFASYEVYRNEDGGSFALVKTISNSSLNYHLDANLDSSKTYGYKVRTVDLSGDISQYSSIVEDKPDGNGSSDTTPPTISGLSISNISTTSATINWATDELSDSSVGYSTDTSYLPERGIATMTKSHSITLTGLVPGTGYNLRIKSRDSAGNLGQNDKDNPGVNNQGDFSFSTLPGPAISSVTVPNIANNQATITWRTTTNSSSYVIYSPTLANGQLLAPKEFGTPDLVGEPAPYRHEVTINSYNDLPLLTNTRYYFEVKSVDATGNIATDNNGGNFYELLTTQDNVPPVISALDAPFISQAGAAITWVTDEPASSKVAYKKSSDSTYVDSQEISTYDRNHFVILNGLDPDTGYDYKVYSKDINGNLSESSSKSFTTLKDSQFQHPPLDKIENIETPEQHITDTNAIITFTTDQNALCLAEVTTSQGSYTNPLVVLEDGYDQNDKYNGSHAIRVLGLVFSTPYYYRITCHDNLKDQDGKFNFITSEEKSFSTKEKMYTQSGADALLDHVAPVITNVGTSATSGESVTITWDTDEKASSSVGYGVLNSKENVAGDQLVNESPASYVISHTVVITGLIPATKYLFKATSVDTSGNVGLSNESSFTTASPSTLSSITVTSTEIGQATVTWSTKEETTSIVEYGLTTTYSDKKESTTLTKDHSITLSNLDQESTYHFRVKGKNADGIIFASADNTFQPKSPPKITSISIENITEHEATVKFQTNVPTDATVIYTDAQNPDNSGNYGKPDYLSEHEITLKNLLSGVTFGTKIRVRDIDGSDAEIAGPDFTTAKDENPPAFEKVKTDMALGQNEKVQTIISWTTNEQAKGEVVYREGGNGAEQKHTLSSQYSLSQTAVITTLKPGTVYNYKIQATDVAGNTSNSDNFSILTPKKSQNVIQFIMETFQDIFGWAKMG